MAVGGRMFLAPLLAAAAAVVSSAATSSSSAALAAPDDDGAWLGAGGDVDDECAAAFEAGEASDCSLNAIQRRALRAHKQQREEEAKRSDSAAGEKTGSRSAPSPPAPPAAVAGASLAQGGEEEARPWHYARNCWDHCNEVGGFCEWCGPGNACCNYMHQDEPECQDVSFWPVLTFHTCVNTNVKQGGNGTLPAPPEGCEDITPMCTPWSDQGECDKNADYMSLYCKKSCGQCSGEGDVDSTPPPGEDSDSASSSGNGQQEQPGQQPGSGAVAPEACEDSNEQCYLWTVKGECDKNPGYMKVACKRSCNQC